LQWWGTVSLGIVVRLGQVFAGAAKAGVLLDAFRRPSVGVTP
jgi:hypothetical protein